VVVSLRDAGRRGACGPPAGVLIIRRRGGSSEGDVARFTAAAIPRRNAKIGGMKVLALPWFVIAAAVLVASPAGADGADIRYVDEVFVSVDVTSDIAYGQSLDEFGVLQTLFLDLYEPSGDTETSRPVVIVVHGGGFTSGSKSGDNFVAYATQMAERGFVSASIDYRLRQEPLTQAEQFAAAIDAKHDAQAAVRWFRANAATYNINADQISMAGSSAGAVTSLAVGYTSDDPGDSGNPGYPSDISAVIDVAGTLGGEADGLMEPGEPPLMIVHGTNDSTVPYSGATELVAAAEADGIPYELHTYVGEGHGVFGAHLAEITEWSGLFIFNHVLQIDTDGDGCWDSKEAGPDETLGGQRDYKNPWDFYDVLGPGAALPTDGVIDLANDILGVIVRFAPLGTEPEYDVRFDRGPQTGANVWNMSAPDGVIDLANDILGVILQFNHRCV